LNEEWFEGQRAALKYSRGFDMSPPPPLCAVRRLQNSSIPMTAFEQSPQDSLSWPASMQDQDQTTLREYRKTKSNSDYGSEIGLRKSNVSLAREFWCISRGGGGFQPPTGLGFRSKLGFSGNPQLQLYLAQNYTPASPAPPAVAKPSSRSSEPGTESDNPKAFNSRLTRSPVKWVLVPNLPVIRLTGS
jgi:hypothetical protein